MIPSSRALTAMILGWEQITNKYCDPLGASAFARAVA